MVGFTTNAALLQALLIILQESIYGALTPKSFNVVGFFEPHELKKTISNEPDSPAVLQKAVEYVKHDDMLVNVNATLDSFPFNVTSGDGFLLSKYVCEDALTNLQMAASLGLRSSSLKEYMQFISDAKKVPYLELTPSLDYSRDMVIQMHPDPSHLVDLMKCLIKADHKEWGWKNVFIVYEAATSITNYLELLTLHKKDDLTISSYHIDHNVDYTETLEYIREVGSMNIIVDCPLNSIPRFLNKALEKQMLTKEYHYHFTSLDLQVLDLTHYSFGGALITWSQLVNWTPQGRMSPGVKNYEGYLRISGTLNPSSYYFTTQNALIVDAIRLLAKALREAVQEDGNFNTKSINCDNANDKWHDDGHFLRTKINQRVEENGLTGRIKFLPNGQRVNYTMLVMKLEPGGYIKNIGKYTPPPSDDKMATGKVTLLSKENKVLEQRNLADDYVHRTLRVTTLELPPYLMKKENHAGDILEGNDRYDGYVVELMERIAKEAKEGLQIDLKYEFQLVNDNEYGSYKDGKWDGMVGEILNNTADLAVAPLTINYEREQVIDFTKPFMTLGIAILYKLPEKEPPHMLSFMEPINIIVWATIVVSVLVVSFSMYIFSRFSPTEWENPFPCQENYEFLENQFNLSNAFWFSVGSIMQQGCEIMPKAPSTRIIAISWWLFTLIIISSYTANLAAFLTITTLSDTFKNADDLAGQIEVPYGCKNPGNTCMFFNKSKIDVYKNMWNFMNTTTGAFSETTTEGINRVKEGNYAFLMESSSIQYQTNTDPDCELTQVGPPLNSQSYGIGVPNGSSLRDKLSNIILLLNEKQVLLELYNKWWKVDDNKCKLKEAESNLQLELQNLEGIFVFLLGGLGVALLVLCVEILAYAVARSKREKVSACKLLVEWLKNSVNGTFPNSVPSSSMECPSISSHGNLPIQNHIKKHMKKHTIIEEEAEPLNGHTDRVPSSYTSDTLVPPH